MASRLKRVRLNGGGVVEEMETIDPLDEDALGSKPEGASPVPLEWQSSAPTAELVKRKRACKRWWENSSFVPTYLGIVLVIAGFGLIAIAWAQVAGRVDVYRQIPYIISAGLPGLGLIMSGLLLINIAAKRQDAAERRRQIDQLIEALRDLRRSMDE